MSIEIKTKVCLVRHAQTEWNLQRRYQGQLNSPLTPVGIAQTRALAVALEGRKFDRVLCSDLGRTWQTGEIVCGHLGLEMQSETRLRERSLGVLQGGTHEENRVNHPEAFEAYTQKDAMREIPGGESLHVFSKRCTDFLEHIAKAHEGESILLITHGGVMSMVFRYVVGLSLQTPRRFHSTNTAISDIMHSGEAYSLVSWNQVSHLGEIELY